MSMAASVLLLLLGSATAAVAATTSAAPAPPAPAPPAPYDPAFDLSFPEGFLFSSATASYQVEGAWNVSGKGENIWDRASHEHPDLILDRSNGDVACDSYHKYKEDIKMAKELGTKMYRFSLSWSRLLPTGAVDSVNEDGIRYYNAIIQECNENNIEPMITIFHWDLPQPLQDLGGFPNEVIVDYFVDYADFVFKTFGDKVKWWITLNEPWSICADGYGSGGKAPAIKAEGRADYLCAHTVLKAHARAYHLYRDTYFATQQGKIGFAANSNFYFPKDPDDAEDVAAAKRAQDFNLGWYTHAVFSKDGDYPAEMKRRIREASMKQGLKRSRLPEFTPDEVAYIKGTADFYGINTYTSSLAQNVKPSDPDQPKIGSRSGDSGVRTSVDPNWETTIASWHNVVPEGMRGLLNWIRTEYDNPKVIITENGYPDLGEKKDLNRVRYYRLYLLEVLKAMHFDKCNVIGYTAWSLMDNYEWFFGYKHKFGLYYVDFADPERPRTPKMSAKFYQRLIETRKVPQDGDIDFPDDPTTLPSTLPSTVPSTVPSTLPSTVPSTLPSTVPSTLPSTAPKPPSTDTTPSPTPSSTPGGQANSIVALLMVSLVAAMLH